MNARPPTACPGRSPGGLDPEAAQRFESLYRECYPTVVRLCRRYVGARGDAEALAQEAFVRAFLSWSSFADERPFLPWISMIAYRVCLNNGRSAKRRIPFEPADVLEGLPNAGDVDAAEHAARSIAVRQALGALSERHRRIVVLRDMEGWSYRDIATFEALSVEAVRASLKRARATFRDAYARVTEGALGVLGWVGGTVAAVRHRLLRAGVADPMHRVGFAGARVLRPEAAAIVVALLVAPPVGTRPDVPSTPTPPPSETAIAPRRTTQPTTALVRTHTSGQGRHSALAVGQTVAPQARTAASPGDGADYTITASPSYRDDGTVFASGRRRDCTGADCYLLLKSSDRGATWERLDAVGFQGGRILLPPSYPRDSRLFAAGYGTLAVSRDGGRSFADVAPALDGAAVMSPMFSDGDPRIVMTSRPLTLRGALSLQYDDATGDLAPLVLDIPASASPVRFAFSERYATDHTMYVAAVQPGDALSGDGSVLDTFVPTVFRCVARNCDRILHGGPLASDVHVLPPAGGRREVVAWTTFAVHSSEEGAEELAERTLPGGDRMAPLLDVVAAPDGRLYALVGVGSSDGRAAGLYASDDGARTWRRLGSLGGEFAVVTALPDGRLLLQPAAGGGGLRCSVDEGRTWSDACAA